jgi:hypothetical protein
LERDYLKKTKAMNTAKTTTKENAVAYLMELLQNHDTKEDFILEFYIFWVENVTIRLRDFQNVLASASVNKWWLQELAKHEEHFREIAASYQEIAGKDKDQLYCTIVNKMMSRFPKALLDQAQKREAKPQLTKVAGKRIEYSIINQN